MLTQGPGLVGEPSGAVATAAFLTHPDVAAGRTVAIVSGGNIDPVLLAETLQRRP